MNACCPNCSSPAALGTEVASICTECASVSLAGTSFSIPMMMAAAATAMIVMTVAKRVRRSRGRIGRLALA